MIKKSDEFLYLNALTANIIIYQCDGKITFANAAAVDFLGVPVEELRQKNVNDFYKIILTVNQQPYKGQKLPFDEVLETKRASAEFIINVFMQGKYKTLNVSASPIFNDKNKLKEVVVLFRDVTESARQREFQQVFIKLLGHELKQPLGLIRAYLYYFKKFFKGKSFGVGKYVDKIDTQVSLLTQMFNDITDATKFSFNTLTIQPKETDILELLDSTIADLKAVYKKRSIELVKEDSILPLLNLDEIKMRQAFTNLIRNAVKYSESEDPIKVTVVKMPDEVLIAISDEGVGIDEQEIEHVFEPYYRANSGKSVRGLGLGLALVKNIIQRHNGRITVTSKKNEGSTFSVFLPIK